ncbi:MAG: SpoIIE family protein phosphatase, partial [Spirochaetales bacterium]|nr:SpoIIE family protein phosphatase [Spirochaetales bacterium]
MHGKAPVILIVDDVETNLLILRAILGKEGFDVIEASDGIMCREIAVAQKPDLILLDIMMPEEDGFQTCIKLKENPVTMDIPVIFVSALSETENKIQGFSVGAVDYVIKPYDHAEILARVRLHLRLSQAMKAVVETQANRLRQLTLAQQAILIDPLDLPEAVFSVYYKSVLEAGGDFYDVLPLGKDIYGYFCADVSGHDLGASLATSSFKALISQNSGVLNTPKETLRTVNSVLEKVLPSEIYLTAVYLLLNRQKKNIQIASAGHPPVIYLPSGGFSNALPLSGDFLGMFENVTMEILEMKVASGDRFYIYTDGIIESDGKIDISREEGLENLVKQIDSTREFSIDKSVDVIINSLFGG